MEALVTFFLLAEVNNQMMKSDAAPAIFLFSLESINAFNFNEQNKKWQRSM
jgi:hypothetical protein